MVKVGSLLPLHLIALMACLQQPGRVHRDAQMLNDDIQLEIALCLMLVMPCVILY